MCKLPLSLSCFVLTPTAYTGLGQDLWRVPFAQITSTSLVRLMFHMVPNIYFTFANPLPLAVLLDQ
jgi:hypothetical protein